MTPMADLPELRLKPREDRRIRGGHLWIYSNEIDVVHTPVKDLSAGDLVRVLSDRGQFLGHAGVNPHTLIAGRILSRDPAHPPGPGFLKHRLKSALALRRRLYPSRFCRLLFGESDGIPGLVAMRSQRC